MKSENTSDAGGGQCLGYTSNGAWAEYLVTVRNAGNYTARLRVATDKASGGTITIKIGDKKVAAVTVNSTGGWSSWKTTDNCAAFKLSTGETKLRIEWSGTASSLVNLNWIAFTCNDSDTSDTTPPDTTTPPLLMPNGRILYNKTVKSRQIQIPLKNSLQILKVQSGDGSVVTIPVMGMRN